MAAARVLSAVDRTQGRKGWVEEATVPLWGVERIWQRWMALDELALDEQLAAPGGHWTATKFVGRILRPAVIISVRVCDLNTSLQLGVNQAIIRHHLSHRKEMSWN